MSNLLTLFQYARTAPTRSWTPETTEALAGNGEIERKPDAEYPRTQPISRLIRRWPELSAL